MLVTNEEYTPEVYNNLSNKIGSEYIINFIESPEGSEAKVVSNGN